MRAFKLTALAFGLALGFGASEGRGQTSGQLTSGQWRQTPIGGTCVPDSATIRAGQYETAGFGVRFSGNSVGKIRLLCPLNTIHQYGSGFEIFTGMWMSVIDADGMEPGGHIRAHLRRAKHGTNIWIAIGACDSNTSNTTTPHTIICNFDPWYTTTPEEWYWWDVEIERITRSVNVEFLGIDMILSRPPPSPSGGERP
jgi:hypothetical protein